MKGFRLIAERVRETMISLILIQKAWDNILASSAVDNLVSRCNNKINKARLKAAAAPHSGDWLNAIPITSVGLRLSDETIRVAVRYRFGSPTCDPHTCVCGGQVDARDLHGLACKKSTPRHIRHSIWNDILWRA